LLSLLAAELALLSVGRRVYGRVRRDLRLSARQHLLRRDESDGASLLRKFIHPSTSSNSTFSKVE
jgi:hypothetical protein